MMRNENLPNLIKNSNQIESYHTFKDNVDGISSFSQNKIKRNQVATVSFDATIKIYDITMLKLLNNLTEHKKGVWKCDFSSMNSLFVSGGNDNQLILWDSNTYKAQGANSFHQDAICDVKFSYNGNLIASCSKGVICIWDVKRINQPLTVIETYKNDYINSINFVDNDKFILYGNRNGEIKLQELNDLKNMKICSVDKFVSLFEPPSEMYINPKNTVYSLNKFKNKKEDDEIFSSHEDGSVRIWKYDKNQFKEIKSFCYFNYPSTSSNSSFDDKLMISSSKDHSAVVWEYAEEERILYSLVGHSDVVTCADFVSNDIVATSSYDSTFKLWKLS